MNIAVIANSLKTIFQSYSGQANTAAQSLSCPVNGQFVRFDRWFARLFSFEVLARWRLLVAEHCVSAGCDAPAGCGCRLWVQTEWSWHRRSNELLMATATALRQRHKTTSLTRNMELIQTVSFCRHNTVDVACKHLALDASYQKRICRRFTFVEFR